MFRTNVQVTDGWQVVALSDSEAMTHAEIIPFAGAMLNRLFIQDVNVIDGYTDKDDFLTRVHDGFRSAKLSPFVCRLHQSTYSWEGISHTVEKFALQGSALHGILYDAPFDVLETRADEKQASVSLRYQYDGQTPGYPFPFNCTITYTLRSKGRLELRTHVTNPAGASSSLPLCDGWHPYFSLGGKVDDWFLEICSDQMMEYDAALIPTGKYITNDTYYPGRLIGADQLDNGFLLREGHAPFCTLKNERVCIEFLSHQQYPFLQLYIPEHRKSIAIENLSGAPDAFNNGIGLTVLKPGEKIDFEVEWRISAVQA
jgi:aldose 1-epimerase